MISIPQRIKGCRKSLGLTQEEFAKQFQVTKGTVSTWERGIHFPTRRVLEKLHYLEIGDDEYPEDCTYEYVFKKYCELPNFDKGVLFAMICAEREESCI